MKNINIKVFTIFSCCSTLFACDQREWRNWGDYPSDAETSAASSRPSVSTAQSSGYQPKGKGQSKGKKGKGKGKGTTSSASSQVLALPVDPVVAEQDLPEPDFTVLPKPKFDFDYSIPEEIPAINLELAEKATETALLALFQEIQVFEPKQIDRLRIILTDLIEGAVPLYKRVEYVERLLEALRSQESYCKSALLNLAKMDLNHQCKTNPVKIEVPATISVELAERVVEKVLRLISVGRANNYFHKLFQTFSKTLKILQKQGLVGEVSSQLYAYVTYTMCMDQCKYHNTFMIEQTPELKQFEMDVARIWENLKSQLFSREDDDVALRKRVDTDIRITNLILLEIIDPAHRSQFLQLFSQLTPADYVKNPGIFEI